MSYSSEVLADSPVHYWRLNDVSGGFADSGSSPEDATANGTPVYGVTPFSHVDGTAVTFSGDDYGQCPTVAWSFGDVFTIEALIKTALSSNQGTIYVAGTDNPNFRVDGATGNLQIIKQNVSIIAVSTVAVNDDQWHHVAWTKNGATNKIYVDAVDRTGAVTDATITNGPHFMGIGGNIVDAGPPTAGLFFIGNLDEIAVYTTALSQARITAHYNAATADTAVQVLAMQTHVFGHGVW